MRSLLLVAAVVLSAPLAVAQNAAFTVSGGYSNIQLGHSNGLFYQRSGGYLDGDVLWRVPDLSYPLLLGVGASGSGHYDSRDTFVTFNDGTAGDARLYSDLGFFTVEGRAALPIRIPGTRGFFVMPRIGAGLLIDSYSIDRFSNAGGFTFIDTDYHDGAAFEIRPALQAGYAWDWGSVGAEVSYMAAWGDFGRFGSKAQEVRAGVFVRVRF